MKIIVIFSILLVIFNSKQTCNAHGYGWSVFELNDLGFESFINVMGNVVYSPMITGALWRLGPFTSIDHLMSGISMILDELPLLGILFIVNFKLF